MAKIEKHDGKLRIKNKYVPAFNFDDLTNDESKAVNWALQRIKQLRNSGVSYDMIEAELKVRFNINKKNS